MKTKLIGKLGEEIAKKFLIKKGYKIIDTNLKLKNLGEIDILCQKDNFLNFVEVKTLKDQKNFLPEIHFNNKKLNKFKKLSNYFANKINFENWIVSLVAIEIKNKKIKIRYYENLTNQ